MSPFLAQVQVINVAGSAQRSADDAIAAARAAVNQALDAADHAVKNAPVRSDDAEPETPIKNDSSDKDDDDSAEKTVRVSKDGVVVVKHKKSQGDDIPAVVVPCVAIFFVFSYLIVRALMAPFSNRNRRGAQPPPVVMGGLSAEETALLEKLQRTLTQMESRVESLETILIDQARTKEKYGTKL